MDVDVGGGGKGSAGRIVGDRDAAAGAGRAGVDVDAVGEHGRVAIADGHFPVRAAVAFPVRAVIETNLKLRGVVRHRGEGEGEGVRTGAGHHRICPVGGIGGEVIERIHGRGRGQDGRRGIEVDGEGGAIRRCRGREGGGRAGAGGGAVAHHIDVLDVGLVEIALGVLGLDVVVDQRVAEERHLGKIIIGDRQRRDEIIDLAVVGGRIQRRAGAGQGPLGHGDGNPAFDVVAAREGFVLVVGHGVDAVLVAAHLQDESAVRYARDVVGVGPDVEIGAHLLVEGGVGRHDIEPAECVGARIVGEPLGAEDGRRGVVVGQALGSHPRLEDFQGAAVGEGLLDFIVVAQAAVVVEAGIEAAQIDVPGAFDIVGAGRGTIPVVGAGDFPGIDRAPLVLEDLFGGFAPVGAGDDGRPVPEFQREARGLEVNLGVGIAGGAVGRGRRIDPLQEVGGAVAHFREDPGAVFDVGGGGVAAVLVDEILDGGRVVAGTFAAAEERRRGFHPRTVAAAPGVVAVRGRQDDGRIVRVGGKRGDVAADHADFRAGIARLVALHVVGGDGNHDFFNTARRVDIFHLVELIRVGRDVPGAVAGIRGVVPPAGRRRRPQQIGPVRRAGIDVEIAVGRALVEIGRTGARKMVAGHDNPFVALLAEDIDHFLGEGHFRREESLGVVGEIAVLVPRLPPDLLERVDFLAENRLGQDGAEGVVVGEADHVHAAAAAGGGPAHGFAIAIVPAGAIAQFAGIAEAADVFNQGSGITDGIAGAGRKRRQRIAGAALIGGHAVAGAEDVGQVVVGVLGGGVVVLGGFLIDGILGELHARGLGIAAIPFGPVDGLVVVPETGNAHVGCMRRGPAAGNQEGEGRAPEEGQTELVCCVHCM